MTTGRPFWLPSPKLIGIAALAGILAGAAAVYMKEAGDGNGADGVGKIAAATGECEGAAKAAERIKPFLKGEIAAMNVVSKPRKLKASFKGPDGQPLTLDRFAGKTVLFNLWATWCGPCREEMPALGKLQKEMGGDGFAVVPVNIDSGDDEKPKAFLADTGVDALPLYRDSTMSVFSDMKAQGLAFGLPVTALLDGKGCIVSAMNGPAAWDSADAKALIKTAVGDGT